MEVYDNLISILEELLRITASFGPSTTSFPDVLLHFRDTAIGARCWIALGFDAHNLRIEILDDGLHVIAIDRSEEVFEYFDFRAHGFHRGNPSDDELAN